MIRRQASAFWTAATPQRHNPQARRLDRLNAKVAEVLALMRAGSALHLTHGSNGQPTWRLSTGRYVDIEVARLVIINPTIIGVGDALPIVGEGRSQTWRFIDDETA